MAKGYSLDALVSEHYMKSRVTLGTTHLDTYTGIDAVGVYFQTGNVDATVANGYPAGAQAGSLEVLPHNANKVGRVMHRYTNFANKRMWVRSQSGGAGDENFYTWTEYVNMDNIYNAMYPVGIVVQFNKAVNPNNTFPGTSWTQITDGRAARAATSATAGTTAGQIGSTGGSDNVTLGAGNIPSHLHSMAHTHSIPSHSHTIAHTHTINSHTHGMNHDHTIAHDHPNTTSSSAGAHTHTVSGTAASAGAHTHPVRQGVATSNTSTGGTGGDNMQPSNTGSAGAHTHTVSGTAASAGAHTHTVDIPVYNGNSGWSKVINSNDSRSNTDGTALTTNGSSAASSGGTALTTDNITTNTGSTGSGSAFSVLNASHYYSFWERTA